MQLSRPRLHLTTRRQERYINTTDFSGLQITVITKCTNIILCIVPKCTNLIMYRERIHMQAHEWHFMMIWQIHMSWTIWTIPLQYLTKPVT